MPGGAAHDAAHPRAALILLAAGAATRFGSPTNKVFQSLAGRSVLTWSLDSTAALPAVTRTLLVVRDDERIRAGTVIDGESPVRDVEVVAGGASRHESEYNALRVLAPDISRGAIDLVVIHDAARPLAGQDLFTGVIDAARTAGGAVPGRRVDGLLPVPGGDTIDGTTIYVQTPQAFRALDLLRSYQTAATRGFDGSDTSSCVERFSDLEVRWLPGPATNIKITFAEDMLVAERIVERARAAAERTASAARTDSAVGQRPEAR
jgi:2-C-methyl-D-erythritol 4-phosphate cytidylyltransferase